MNFLFKLSVFLFSSALFAQQGTIRIEQDIYVKSDTIKGTLVSPFELNVSKLIKKTPLVIMIPGSGPTDRNGNSMMAKGANNTFLQLADSLAKKGIASYRYDKPGVGKSTINFKETDFRFEDNVSIVLAIIEQLKKDIGFEDIFIMGHSEGSLIGMLAAQKTDIEGYISLAGPGRNACEVLKDQMRKNLPEFMKAEAIEKLDSLGNGHMVHKYNPSLASLFRKSVQPYIISWFKYTPGEEIAKLKSPVLIIQGGRDLQVEKIEGESLAKANNKAQYLVFDNMNHVLKEVGESQEENLAAYTDEDFRFPKDLVAKLSSWILKQ